MKQLKQRPPGQQSTRHGKTHPAVGRSRLFDLSSIDFKLLHRQRRTLTALLARLGESDFTTVGEDHDLAGILQLLDALQDAAAEAGVWKYPRR
jgi:hypothetical protein